MILGHKQGLKRMCRSLKELVLKLKAAGKEGEKPKLMQKL